MPSHLPAAQLVHTEFRRLDGQLPLVACRESPYRPAAEQDRRSPRWSASVRWPN